MTSVQKGSLALALIMATVWTGCGGDRSTLYDADGTKLKASGKVSEQWIYEREAGRRMVTQNFVYIPGGFDVDGDGLDENGFWLAKYEAREGNESVSTIGLGDVGDLMRNHFLLYNSQNGRFDQQIDANRSYPVQPLSDLLGFHASKVYFSGEGDAVGSYSAIEAVVALEASQIGGVPWHISLPSEKQWMQLVKLAINNPHNWSSGEVGKGKVFQGKKFGATQQRYLVIANGILGNDTNVPSDYETRVYDLSGNLAEWTRGIFAVDDRFLGGDGGEVEYTSLGNNTPRWWMPILEGEATPLPSIYGTGKYFDGSTRSGATDTLNLTGATGDVDPYAVVARGGSASKGDLTLVGVSAAKLAYGPGFKDPSIGFRGASEYLLK